MQSIANQLQLKGIPYSETSGIWSKHMVRRILENAKYCGQDGFPALIDRDVFTKALKLRQQKAQTPLSGIGDIRKYMACACCHSKLKIDLGTRGKIYWRCHSCGIRIGPIQNEVLIEAVFSYMNDCIQNPDIFKNTSERENSISLQIGKLTQNICRAMECRTTTVEEIMPLIFERTQTQFENLKTLRYDPDTLRLHQLYEQSTELEEINTELVKESIQNILLSPMGEVQLCFINGQIYPERNGK